MSKGESSIASRVFEVEPLEERRLLSVAYGTNLVLNPGAERYSGTADGYNIITPTDWLAGSDPTVARYSRGYGQAIGIQKPDFGGDAFFTGGPDSQDTDFYQLIDLSSIATDIDAGHVNFGLSAQLGGEGLNDDNANVFVTFEDANRAVISQRQTGSVSASDRDYKTEFLTRSVNGLVPASARFAQIQIHFKRDALDGYNNGFADNVDLVMVTNTPSTVGITPSVTRSTLPATVISEARTTGALVLTLTNTSGSVNVGRDTITLLASSDGAVDASSIPIATIKRGLGFGAGKSIALVFPVKTFAIPAGTYTIFAQTTDRYLTVDTALTGPSVVVQARVISLTGTVGAVTPATVNAGRVISFTYTIQNSGNVNSTGLANIAIGLSSDGTTSSAPLRTLAVRLTLKAGGPPVRLRLRVKVPVGQALGSYMPFVIFTQGANSATAVGAVPVVVE